MKTCNDEVLPAPTTIRRLANSVYAPFAMLAGMQLDLFTPLDSGPLTAGQLSDALGAKVEKLSPLLYALVAADLLTLDGDRFGNTAEGSQFLVRGKPSYLGGRHGYYADIWSALPHTAASIRSGTPQALHDFSAMPAVELATFLRSLHPQAVTAGRQLAKLHDFSSHRTLADIGGGTGGMAFALTEANSGLRATVVDLPTVIPVARQCIDEAGAAERIAVLAADVVREPLQETWDVAVLRSLLQVLSPDDAHRALENVAAAINPGGVIHIVGRILDDSRLSPPETVGFNLVFLNVYSAGCAYTEHEHRQWLTGLGFEDIERQPLGEGFSIVTARKPA